MLLAWTWRHRCSDVDGDACRRRGVKEEVSVSKTGRCQQYNLCDAGKEVLVLRVRVS